MAASGSTARRVGATVMGVAVFLGVRFGVEAWRADERTETCLREVVPLYAAAGPSAERVAGFVCEELVLDPPRAGTAGVPTDPQARRLSGILRLHPSDVGEVLAVRRTIVDASPELCAVLWAGGDEGAEARGLALLSDEDLRRFARTVAAISRAGGAARAPAMTEEEAVSRFDALLDELVAGGGPELAAAFGADAGEPERACEATRAVLGAIEALAPAERAVAGRAWLAVEAGAIASADADHGATAP